jgi:Family of unknown function (DUF5313)
MRPTPILWFRYALGGRLPERLHDWVRHDLTDADWRWRQLLRVLVQTALPVVVIAVLPAPWTLRMLMIALVLLGAVSVALAYADELRDRRLRQHGLIPPSRPDVGPPPPEQWGPRR